MKRRWGVCLALLLAALLVFGALGSLADELEFEQTGDESSMIGLAPDADGAALDLSGGSEPEDETAYAEFVGNAGPVANDGFSGTIKDGVLVKYTGEDPEVTIPEAIKQIGKNAFCGNKAIVSVTMSSEVETIGAGAFKDCVNLKTVKLNESLREIGDNAFDGCSELTEISFPKALQTIGIGAFSKCNALTKITVPVNVETIGKNAFYGCEGVTSVTVKGPQKAKPWDEIDANDITGYGANIFSKCTRLESASVDGAYVPEGMFSGCLKLSDVTLGNSVAVIEKNAFKDCVALESFVMKEDMRTIGENAFYGCTALETVTLNADLEAICDGAFRECSALKAISIPGGVDTIGNHAFRDCGKLAKVTLHEGISIIGKYAFSNDVFLSSIIIPESMGNLGRAAFYNCARLSNITVYSQNMKINKNALTNISASPKISAYCTSTTVKWCEQNGLQPTKMHDEVIDKAEDPTCTKPGKTEGKHCKVCGVVLVAQKEKKALGHEKVKDEAVEATYVSTGLTEGAHCKRCGEVLVKQEVIPKLEPTSIKLNKHSATLKLDKTLKLKITMTPKHKTYTQVPLVWYSDNVSVATVTQEGVVKAIGKGTANITVMTRNGLEDTCKITVKASAYEPTGIKLNKTSATLKVDQNLTLKVTFTPKDKRSKQVPLTWYSDNVSVATVTQEGVVKAIGKGTAKITVMTRNGLEASCKITVKAAAYEPTSIKLNKTSATLKLNQKLALKVTFTPKDKRSKKVPLTWYSNNVTVATVTKKGVVKAVGQGTATITVMTRNGLSATCKVTVVNASAPRY